MFLNYRVFLPCAPKFRMVAQSDPQILQFAIRWKGAVGTRSETKWDRHTGTQDGTRRTGHINTGWDAKWDTAGHQTRHNGTQWDTMPSLRIGGDTLPHNTLGSNGTRWDTKWETGTVPDTKWNTRGHNGTQHLNLGLEGTQQETTCWHKVGHVGTRWDTTGRKIQSKTQNGT